MQKKELIEENAGIGQQHNSFRNITKSMNTKELIKALQEKENKYFDLVWYARSRPENINIKGVKENKERIETLYPNEVNGLQSERSDWEHGFNSGMLAAFRYILTLSEMDKETADEEFPNLDS